MSYFDVYFYVGKSKRYTSDELIKMVSTAAFDCKCDCECEPISDIFVNWNKIKTINNTFSLTETKTKTKIVAKTKMIQKRKLSRWYKN